MIEIGINCVLIRI